MQFCLVGSFFNTQFCFVGTFFSILSSVHVLLALLLILSSVYGSLQMPIYTSPLLSTLQLGYAWVTSAVHCWSYFKLTFCFLSKHWCHQLSIFL